MAERQWNKEQPIYKTTDSITLTPQQEQVIPITGIKSDAKALLVEVDFLQSSATAYNFKSKGFANLEVVYKNIELKKENYFINFNRDVEVETGIFKNTCILELKGNDLYTVTLKLFNKSTENLTINSIVILPSKDITPLQIATVLKEQTIAADVVQATSAFTDSLFTQLLQTAVMSMTTRNSQPGQIVEYIKAEDWTLSFYMATLGSEEEQFSITTTTAGQQTTTYYWYAIIDGPDAYRYITTVDPRDKYPDISDSDRNAFKLMVYKPSSLTKKLSIEFANTANAVGVPTIIYGAGVGIETRGQGFTYKDESGFYHIYHTDDDGDVVGIVMDKDGVHIVGWADQHCEYIKFKDNGVKVKFAGEEEQKFEYVVENGEITGYIQNSLYITTVSYEAGTI
jgi:hypothetical protein